MSIRRLFPLALAAALAACGDSPKLEAPAIGLSATALTFAAVAAGADPVAQTVTVANLGGGVLGVPVAQVSSSGAAGWLTAQVSGAAAPYTLTVRARVAGLAAGNYTGTVSLATSSASNSPRSLSVRFAVSVAPIPSAMALAPAALEFRSSAAGVDPAAQAVTVSATGTAPLATPVATVTYPSGGASGWLTTTVSGGAAPFTVTAQVATAGLALGLHTASVELASPGATNTPQAFPVTLFVGRAVDVTRRLTHWTEGGATTTSPDPAVTGVALLQDDGAGGLARTPAVAGLAEGRWTAVAAPGAYLAEVAFADGRLDYAQAGAAVDQLDLGEDRGGRAGGVAPTLATDVTLELFGLDPWQPDDELQLVAWDARAGARLVPGFSVGNADDVATLDWATTGGALLAATDTLRVAQYRTTPGVQILTYQELVAATQVAGTALVDGAAATVTFPLASTPVDSLLSLSWSLSELEAASAPFAASGGFDHRVGFYAIPAPLTVPSPVGAPAATVFEALLPSGYGDVAGEVLSVGRTLPAAWREYRETAFASTARRTAPGATTPVVLQQRVLDRQALPVAGAAGPSVGAVLAPLLEGADALLPATGVPTGATLSWSAPGVGTPTSYRVALHELTLQGAATASRLVAEFTLPATARSLTVPAGLLRPGRSYAALLTARTSPGDAGGASPYRVGLPYGEASLWTEVFTTAP